MNPIPIDVAVEDEISEEVARTLLSQVGGFVVGKVYRRGGAGFLKRTVDGFNNAAAGRPFFLLTDLDRAECPAILRSAWLSKPQRPNLLFRVAVVEVESWLLADRDALASFLNVRTDLIPDETDGLSDPKSFLIGLARHSRSRSLRAQIVPAPGLRTRIGPEYNAALGRFVRSVWSASRAARHSSSLRRTIERCQEFRPSWAAQHESPCS